MKTWIALAIILLAGSGVTRAQSNSIGIFTTETPASFTGTEGLLYLEPVPIPEIAGALSICAGDLAEAVEALYR